MSDENFGYEYESDGGWSEGDEEQNENEVMIINTFYEAEQAKEKNPKEALEKFETVILLEEQEGKDENTFKSLEYIVVISLKINESEKATDAYTKLMKMIDKVARNDKSAAIQNILEAVNDCQDSDLKDKFYTNTLEVLKDTDQKMWLDIQIKLGKLYLEKQDFSKLEHLILELKEECKKHEDPSLQKKPSGMASESFNQYDSYLCEVYCLEIQLCVELGDSKRLRSVYAATEKMMSAINDPRVTGVIKEQGGKMFMREKQWKKACDELFEGFKAYQEVANPQAKTILKYVILASIISNSEINYADTREAKVYQEDLEISALMQLRVAYEKNDYGELLNILNKIKKDDFMEKCLDDFMRNIRLNALVIKIRPYKNVELGFLANELKISEKEVKTLLVELILDQRIDGKIDQQEGSSKTFLELSSAKKDVISKKKHQAISTWLDNLSDLQEKLT
jgi:COP9 signalosome complex subunit 2